MIFSEKNFLDRIYPLRLEHNIGQGLLSGVHVIYELLLTRVRMHSGVKVIGLVDRMYIYGHTKKLFSSNAHLSSQRQQVQTVP